MDQDIEERSEHLFNNILEEQHICYLPIIYDHKTYYIQHNFHLNHM